MITTAGPATQSHSHPLRGLLTAQFFGAFNDNAWKLMVALLAIRQVTTTVGPTGPAFEAASQTQATIAFVVFNLPLMLFSLVAGALSDRLSKRTVIIVMKVVEVTLMGAGTIALLMDPLGGWLALIILAGMGVHSAFFSPAKYGILPELLPYEQLSLGNGLLKMWTFFAIIGGTTAGGLFLGLSHASPWLAGFALTVLSFIGLIAAWTIPRVPAARSEGGVRATITVAWTALRADRMLRLAIGINVMFWTIASLFGQDMLIYAKSRLALSDELSGLPLAVLGIGIGIGAVLAGRLSASKIEVGLILPGCLALTGGLLGLGLIPPSLAGSLTLMAVLGIASGFINVPINALIQWRAPADRRGAVIALGNTFMFGGILAGSLGAGFLSQVGLSATDILLACAGMALIGTLIVLWLLPDSLVRFLVVLLPRLIYRVAVIGSGSVPREGPALLVPNHVSFIDGLLLIASLDRPIRFVVDSRYAEHPLLRVLMKTIRVIPISSTGRPRMILQALREAGQALDEGQLVCIFPEGQITRTGTLLPFRRGFERIVKGRTAPIIPVHLDRVWGSIFSFNHGRFLWKLPEQLPYPVTISFGAPLPPDTTPDTLRAKIHELGEAAWQLRKPGRRPLHRQFISAMRRYPFRMAMADQNRPRVSSLQALIGSIVLARTLRPYWQDQDHVGVLLPPTVAAALVNVAVALCGKTIVNLNYTVGKSGLESAVRLAGLRTIVTSHTFIEKAKLDLPDGPSVIWLEDVATTIGTGQKAVAALLALFAPCRLIERACGQATPLTPDSLATIIFSSGSTGEPKGVMLSHFSIDANCQGATQMLHLYQDERVLGILPFFHSFGYMVFWFVMFNNAPMIFHPSPLDVTAIGELIRQYRLTFIVITPTFLQLYSRRCTPEQFSSVRVILTGAEKLSARLAQSIEDKFGIGPIEGYGVTECAPVIAVNCPDFRAAGYYQPASRRGTVGQPLPGVSLRIVDPDHYTSLPTGTSGMLLVKGPNVMNGYLGREDLTTQVMRDGWYITGDIASLDDDGFLTITDRLSRFSKIGGEMVPHGKVEEALQQAAGVDSQVFAVTGLPDDKKGERLAVLHTIDESLIPDILGKISTSGLPNLFIPSRSQFVKVEALPVLGTGKLDLRGVKRMATERLLSHEEVKD
ncbi:MAG: acyl-[ACP]--phospholipid O-acyltransferase [Nitrospira sp.]|nr:acyl-[ACP]--phospholipid O-acyltransferase [Nitrospira sp.]MDH4370444.1 acyl-[ACP]--phospholipid O-acyltransferase [Nitrospira sp.]MDH5347897.1 acyl-[ACP]--phospholipid O-acyltransferase [Nitrospira sp.]MDH5497109.1 acyl-[ACP]--phospholipid O-acyltransferase [Nitrospira sp.]MDH5723984.1 acyl-[ACP]--phospholipid O-acyltransferase [Nitrospira sp.]